MTEALSSMLGDPLTIMMTVIRVFITYAVVLWLVNQVGQRTLGQMTSFDLVTLLLISEVAQNAMLGQDDSLLGGLLGVATLLGVNLVVARTPALRNRLESDPILLLYDGRLFEGRLKEHELTVADVEAAARESGVASLADVHMAVLEMDGKISIIPAEKEE